MLKHTFELQPHTQHTHTASSYQWFQNRNISKWLLLTGTHLWKRAASHFCTYLWVRYTHMLCICKVFFAGRNGLQVDWIDWENNKQTSPYSQLVPSKLIVACNMHIQQSECGLTICFTPTQLLWEKPHKCLRLRSALEIIFRPYLTTRSSCKAQKEYHWSPLTEQWFGVHNAHTYRIVLKLCVTEKKDEQNGNFHVLFLQTW